MGVVWMSEGGGQAMSLVGALRPVSIVMLFHTQVGALGGTEAMDCTWGSGQGWEFCSQ